MITFELFVVCMYYSEIVGDGAIFSTDEYFIKDGVYQYEYQLLAEAHLWNQRRAKEALAAGKNPVIIDNTNLQAWEMKVYVAAVRSLLYHNLCSV